MIEEDLAHQTVDPNHLFRSLIRHYVFALLIRHEHPHRSILVKTVSRSCSLIFELDLCPFDIRGSRG